MTVDELIKRLKRFKPEDEVCLLDHRCVEAFPIEISVVRRATKKEASQSFYGVPVVLD